MTFFVYRNKLRLGKQVESTLHSHDAFCYKDTIKLLLLSFFVYPFFIEVKFSGQRNADADLSYV